jgi:hypothetical protein
MPAALLHPQPNVQITSELSAVAGRGITLADWHHKKSEANC